MIDLEYLKELLFPLNYQFDDTQEFPIFWKKIPHKDLRSPYAFSLVMINVMKFTVSIEGLNEPRLRRAIRAGLIEVNSAEDVEKLKEVVFETDLETPKKLETILFLKPSCKQLALKKSTLTNINKQFRI